jgi:hypothetical protein
MSNTVTSNTIVNSKKLSMYNDMIYLAKYYSIFRNTNSTCLFIKYTNDQGWYVGTEPYDGSHQYPTIYNNIKETLTGNKQK